MSSGGSVKDLQSKAELDGFIKEGKVVILHFWASWCEASKHMDQVFSHLSTDFPHPLFLRVEAEEQPEISEAYAVSAVPYFVFIKDGKTVDTLEGADPSSLANKVAKVSGSIGSADPAAPASLGMAAGPTILESVQELAKENGSSQINTPPPSSSDDLQKRLQQLISSHPIMLFMKGNPQEPQCGFSSKVVDILNKEKVKFGSFDILSNNEVREGLKKFSNWPTFPQLYCKGELLGGCDIAIAMHESGELKEVFSDYGIGTLDSKEVKSTEPVSGISESNGLSSSLSSRLSSLINSSPVMLFMKGKPDEPKCGFSRKVVDILQQERVEFESFDILTDDEVRPDESPTLENRYKDRVSLSEEVNPLVTENRYKRADTPPPATENRYKRADIPPPETENRYKRADNSPVTENRYARADTPPPVIDNRYRRPEHSPVVENRYNRGNNTIPAENRYNRPNNSPVTENRYNRENNTPVVDNRYRRDHQYNPNVEGGRDRLEQFPQSQPNNSRFPTNDPRMNSNVANNTGENRYRNGNNFDTTRHPRPQGDRFAPPYSDSHRQS